MTSIADEGSVFGPAQWTGWRRDGEAEMPHVGRAERWRHDTGATHVHADTDSTEYAFGLTVRTEAADDLGASHVVEHLIGAGSRRFPTSSPWYTSMFRGMASFLNGFTETGRTSYTFVVGDRHDYDDILRVLLDGVAHPLLGEREFLREGCRHLPGGGGFSGIVYNEMLLKRETERQWVSRLVARATDPGGFGQYRHEGSPLALPGLTYGDCRRHYLRWYRARHMHSFSSGPVLDRVLERLDAEYRSIAEAASPVQPRTPAPLIGPAALGDTAWRVVRTVFAEPASPGSWQRALAARQSLATVKGALVIGPQLTEGRLELLAAVREAACPTTDAELVDRLQAIEDGAVVTPAKVHEHLRQPYATLPVPIQWGLMLAGARLAGIDPLRLADPGSFETTVLRVDSTETASAVPWSAERAVADEAVWRRTPLTASATCLPLRPLHSRTPPALPWPEPVADGVRHIRRPGPPVVYLHSRLPLRPDIAPLTYPVRDFVLQRLGLAPMGPFAGRLVIRDATAGSLADVLLEAPTPVVTRHAITALADSLIDDDEAAILEAARMFVRRRTAALLSSPGEFARRAVAARLSEAGAAAELVDGLTGLRALRSALQKQQPLLPQAQAIIRAWADAPVSLLVVGERLPADLDGGALAGRRATLEPAPPDARSLTQSIRPQGFFWKQQGVSCAGWSTPADLGPALLVLTEHLHRRYLHPEVREHRGAYAVGATWDRPTHCLTVWSEADPDPEGTLADDRGLMRRVQTDPLVDDDVLTAQLMALGSEQRRRGNAAYVAALADQTSDGADDARTLTDLSRVDADAIRLAASVLDTCAFHDGI